MLAGGAWWWLKAQDPPKPSSRVHSSVKERGGCPNTSASKSEAWESWFCPFPAYYPLAPHTLISAPASQGHLLGPRVRYAFSSPFLESALAFGLAPCPLAWRAVPSLTLLLGANFVAPGPSFLPAPLASLGCRCGAQGTGVWPLTWGAQTWELREGGGARRVARGLAIGPREGASDCTGGGCGAPDRRC